MQMLRNIFTVIKRELGTYFTSPLAYVIIIIFLVLAQVFTFVFGNQVEGGQAVLGPTFFQWHPWLFVVVAPAVGMRLWAEEHRLGTMEILATLPVPLWQIVLGKFLAASVVLAVALALTFPIVLTIGYLGDPDPGPIITGYIASFLLALSNLSITSAVSAFTRNQIVCLLISIAVCLFFTMAGIYVVTDFVYNLFASNPNIADIVASFSLMTHFYELTKGVLLVGDLVFFISVIVFCLFVSNVVLNAKRA